MAEHTEDTAKRAKPEAGRERDADQMKTAAVVVVER
jgi:hypothetical protein